MNNYHELISALRCNRLGCVCQKEPNGKGALLHCPAHEDAHPSLSFTVKDDKPLWKCMSGCDQEAVRGAFIQKGMWHTPRETNALAPGLTLAQYADAKKLPLDFLKSLGLADQKYKGAPAVRIPYLDPNGNAAAVRFRVGMRGHRFEWKAGSKVMLYGLDRSREIRRAGWVILLEGESDCHTLWYYGLPALGLPGKTQWRDEWKAHLAGLTVFVWQEPDAQDMTHRIGISLPALRVIVAPEGIKDISEAHLRGLGIPAWLETLKASAIPFGEIQRQAKSEHARELETQAASILNHPDPLQLVQAEIRRLGYGGDMRAPLIVYLAATSRLLGLRAGAMVTHVILIGPPSGGKSYTMNVIRKLIAPEGWHSIEAGSARALIYANADLAHRVVFFGEADSLPSGEDNPAASAIRNLLQEGRLAYSTVVRDAETNEFKTVEISKEGPTVLLTTATRRLGEQLMTRLFTLEIGDEPEHIRAALQTQAAIEREGVQEPDPALIAFQGYLQTLAPFDVFIPYTAPLADMLGQAIPAPRMLRDFARLLSLVKAVTLLRHRQRECDVQGRIVATLEDYETVRELVAQMFADSVSGNTQRTRETVEAVKRILEANRHAKITLTAIMAELGIEKMQASRRARAAAKAGWLVNKETRKGYPADYIIGEPMPDVPGLPEADTLREHLARDAKQQTNRNGTTQPKIKKSEWLAQARGWLERNPTHPQFVENKAEYERIAGTPG